MRYVPLYSIIKIVSALYARTADTEMVLKYIGLDFAGEAQVTQQELLDNCPLYRNMWQQHVAGRNSADEKEGE